MKQKDLKSRFKYIGWGIFRFDISDIFPASYTPSIHSCVIIIVLLDVCHGCAFLWKNYSFQKIQDLAFYFFSCLLQKPKEQAKSKPAKQKKAKFIKASPRFRFKIFLHTQKKRALQLFSKTKKQYNTLYFLYKISVTFLCTAVNCSYLVI